MIKLFQELRQLFRFESTNNGYSSCTGRLQSGRSR